MEKQKILIIDDDYIVLDLLRETLCAQGYEVLSADNGLAGLEQLIRQKPQLVLLDVMMPGLDGYEVCKKIKQSPITACIPLIFITAKAQPEDVEIGLSLGADDYITKPFDVKELMRRVAAVLTRYQRGDSSS